MERMQKRQRKIRMTVKAVGWLAALALLLACLIPVRAEASGSSGQVYALGFVQGLDSEGQMVSLGTGVALVGEGGVAYVYTSPDIVKAEALQYSFITGSTSSGYPLTMSAQDDTLQVVEWLVEINEQDPLFLYVASAYEGQTVGFYYCTADVELKTNDAVITGYYADGYYFLQADGVQADNMVYPAVLLDEGGFCVGIVTGPELIYAPLLDEAAFSSGSGSGGGGTSGGGSTGEESQGGGNSDGDTSGGNGASDGGDSIWNDALRGAIIGLVAAAAVYILRKIFKKGSASPDAGDTAPGPVPTPTPDPFSVSEEFDSVPDTVQGPRESEIPPVQEQAGFRLYARGGYMDGRIYDIGESEITFGRDPASTVRFPADTKGVSRVHCKLFWNNGTLMLMDSGSKYGTFVEGKGKLRELYPVAVQYGDIFYIGEKKNAFEIR